jgi:hypothetical protein
MSRSRRGQDLLRRDDRDVPEPLKILRVESQDSVDAMNLHGGHKARIVLIHLAPRKCFRANHQAQYQYESSCLHLPRRAIRLTTVQLSPA